MHRKLREGLRQRGQRDSTVAEQGKGLHDLLKWSPHASKVVDELSDPSELAHLE